MMNLSMENHHGKTNHEENYALRLQKVVRRLS